MEKSLSWSDVRKLRKVRQFLRGRENRSQYRHERVIDARVAALEDNIRGDVTCQSDRGGIAAETRPDRESVQVSKDVPQRVGVVGCLDRYGKFDPIDTVGVPVVDLGGDLVVGANRRHGVQHLIADQR